MGEIEMPPAAEPRVGEGRALVRNAAIYTVGFAAIRFGGFLLIPIYWRVLEPQDFGLIAVVTAVSSFLGVFLGLGISESITRFYHAWPTSERAARLGSIWITDWSTSLLAGVPLALWGGAIFPLFVVQVPFHPFLQMGVATAVLSSFATTPLATLRVQERARAYVACAACAFTIKTVLSLGTVLWLRHGVMGVIEADLLTAAAMVPVYAWVMLGVAVPRVQRPGLATALGYSLPLLPAVLVDSLVPIADRLVLEKYVALWALGFYALGDTLTSVVRILGTSLKNTWIPYEMRLAIHDPEARRKIGAAATTYVSVLLCAAVGVALLGPSVIYLIGVEKYYPVASLIPFLALPQFLIATLPIFSGGLGIARRTEFALVVVLSHVIVGLPLLVLLVPRWNVYGAIVATSVAAVARLCVATVLSQRFYRVDFQWDRLALMVGSAVVLTALMRLAPSAKGSAADLCIRGLAASAYIGVCLVSSLGRPARWRAALS